MSSSRSPLVELLSALREVLDAVGVRWYLFGAQAAIVHGAVRLTADVDITVDLGARSITALVEALTRGGFEPRVPDVATFVASTRVLPLVHRQTRIPVDAVLAGPGLEDLFFAQTKERDVGGVSVPVASAEDVVVMKVLAGRLKDLEDAVAIVRAQQLAFDLERARVTLGQLEAALDRHDLLEELERIRARAARS